MKPWRNPGFFL